MSHERVRLFAVVGMTLTLVLVLIGSFILAMQERDTPQLWIAMGGGAIGSLGTLLASSPDGKGDDSEIAQTIAQAVNASVAQAMAPASPAAPGPFSNASGLPMEEGLYQGE